MAGGGGAVLKAAVALALLTGVSGCVEAGDLGRPKPSFLNEVVLPTIGSEAARARGEAVSDLPLTDAEEELRDRSWRFLMPAHERPVFDSFIANLVRTRVLPAERRQPVDAYYAGLMSVGARSPASRFRRIGEDAEADAALVRPFGEVAARVIAADAARMKGLTFLERVSAAEIADVVARVAENRCLIAWVRDELAARASRYSYAVEHAFVAMPQGEAVAAERAVRGLDLRRGILDTLPVPSWRSGACLQPAMVVQRGRAVIVKG